MSEELYRKYIMEMLERISGEENLKQVYGAVHRVFIKKGAFNERKD